VTIEAREVEVTDEPTRLDSNVRDQAISIKNVSGETVYLGGSEVSTADGYPLEPEQHLSIDLETDDSVYGVVATGPANVRVLESGV
jgi:hypothetical protein